jgi:hypothetical protein
VLSAVRGEESRQDRCAVAIRAEQDDRSRNDQHGVSSVGRTATPCRRATATRRASWRLWKTRQPSCSGSGSPAIRARCCQGAITNFNRPDRKIQGLEVLIMGCLYSFDFNNGKSYIGITLNTPQDRMRRQMSSVADSLVSRAIKKHGMKAVDISILAIANDWNYLCLIEIRAINIFGTLSPGGYNLTSGGEGGFKREWSKEQREAVSKFHKGRKRSPETCERISEAQVGIPKNWTDDWKRNILKSLVGNKFSLGKKHTDDSKVKQSIKRKAWWAGLSEQDREEFCKRRARSQSEKKKIYNS